MKVTGTYPNLRMRRNRKADWIRRLVSEHNLSANDLILPLFVREGFKKKESINSMPGIFCWMCCQMAAKFCCMAMGMGRSESGAKPPTT